MKEFTTLCSVKAIDSGYGNKSQTKALRIFVLLLCFGIFGSGSILKAQLVGYTLTSNNSATSGISLNYPSQGRVISLNGLTSSSYSSANGWTVYGWDEVGSDAWATSEFSTSGYINISGSCQMKANTTYGPKDFKIQYSINGTDWNDVATGATVSLTNSLITYNFTFPSDCDNKANMYVRWILNSTSTIGGGTLTSTTANNSSYNASLKGVSIAGDAFAAPSTQASNISIIAVTPTTIKVGCTNGNGNRRIIVINNVNSFTDYPDDFLPSGVSTVYSGTGEQIIYNGTGSQVKVTVPSATSEFWFRVYDYNLMDDLTRYNVSTASLNPKQCLLETIHSPTSTNVRLTRVNLGATITTPPSGTISERGIFWSTTSPVDETSNLINETTDQGGVFVLSDIDVDRGQTIYFKGFVANLSGIIMTEESSFSNVPVFSGTGNWEDASKWNVQEVPGANGDVNYGSVEDSPIIDGTCTLTSANNVTNLTVNANKRLTISPDVLMRVDGTLTNNGGTNGILLKSSETQGNGSLVFAHGTPLASVEMYSKAYWNLSNPTGSKYAWQYFGIPVTSCSYGDYFAGTYVRSWDESVTDYYNIWARTNSGTSLQLGYGSTLQPGVAYELCQQNPKTYVFGGTLTNADYSRSLQYTPTAYYKGQNMLSNPYAAAMNITDIQFGSNTVQAVYLYNTGTYNDWLTSNGESTPGSGPGTYTASTPETAGAGGIPSQIPSMQGFMVKATANPGSISYSYASLIPNNTYQKSNINVKKICTTIDVLGTNFSDRMWLFVNDNCTDGFDNGFDGPKMLGYEGTSQIYGIGSDDIYQINAVRDVNNVHIGFQPGTETAFKLKFTHQNTDLKYSSLYLIDMVAGTVTDISESGSEYSFTSVSTDAVDRFKIVTSTTDAETVSNDESMNVYQSGDQLVVVNKANEAGVLSVYNMMGKRILIRNIDSNSKAFIAERLQKGSYIVNLVSGSDKISKCVIVK